MALPEHSHDAILKSRLARASSNPVLLCLLLAAATLFVFWPAIHYSFVDYDDPDYFSSNAHVSSGLTPGNVAWAFRTGFASNWHPLTWLSLMLDAEFFGKGPAGPHFTNLLFHAANTVLLFLLFRRLTAAKWRSAFVAALFALHPLHVESVAWIAERKDVLSAFFWMLTLLAYTRYAQKKLPLNPQPSTLNYLLALFFFALGLMSKPMLVTLPFVMLLLDWWPLERFGVQGSGFGVSRLVFEKIPFLALSGISCVVTFFVQKKGGAVATLMNFSIFERVENAFVSFARYLGKTFWPVNLATPYPHPGHWELVLVICSVALIAGLSAIAVLLARKFPFAFTGWFWFVGTLVPVIGLVQVGGQSMADRYMYLPLIGLFIVLAWGIGEVCLRWRVPRTWAVFLAAIVLVPAALRSRDQLGYWQNDGTLFRHALVATKNNYVASINLGTWLSKQGQVMEAMGCFNEALRMHPSDPSALYDLGNAFSKLGNWDDAIASYRRALQITPDQADILNNLGFALAAKKQFTAAVTNFEAALTLKPDSASAHNNLASVLFAEQKFDEAAGHYREALRLTPDNPQIYANLGDTLLRMNQPAEAAKCYLQALQLNPDDAKSRAKLRALGAPVSN